MSENAILIGNSDGIGLATSEALLKKGWKVIGISRSASKISDPSYKHTIARVQDADFLEKLKSLLDGIGNVDLCVYCAGIGELLDPLNMTGEIEIFDVNLMGMIRTAACVIPLMVKQGKGHFIGISSLADELISPEAPSYHASKAAFSNYLYGLALALKSTGVHVSNMRFGFVNTKMAKGEVKPFMMEVEKAVQHILACIESKSISHTAPWIVIPLVKFRSWTLKLQILR